LCPDAPPDGSKDAPTPLWSGRIEGGMAPEMVPLNDSLGTDLRLWREDVRGSRAWARALGAAAVLTEGEVEALLLGLDNVSGRLESGEGRGAGDEDVHSLVERLLHEEAGEVAGKLHTGRSRNDQVATDVRLWGMKACETMDADLGAVLTALVAWAERSVEVVMPGFTHLQQAQPVRAAHWILSRFWPLQRDREFLRQVAKGVSVLPLGSGAIAGCPFPIDREFLMRELGFGRLSPNSIDAVSDRDWMLDVAYLGARIGLHLSQLAEDLMIFSSQEFGYVRLSDGFSTGSSLMPQKRNPDLAELTRGKSARLVGGLSTLMTLVKGLPTGYNRDLQEDKDALFGTVDTLAVLLPAVAGAVSGAELMPDRIRARMDTRALATDLADQLVRAGVPFRQSHEVVAGLVRTAEELGVELHELDGEVFSRAHEAFGVDTGAGLDFEASVEAREVSGGTARVAVLNQLELARGMLAD
jgi:argininosuccinate lyase